MILLSRNLTKLRRRRQRERQTSNRFNEQNNNSASSSRFFTFLCCLCTTRTWNDQIWTLLENGNSNAINSTISVWTRARSPLFSSNLNSLLLCNRATWDNSEIVWKDENCIFHRSLNVHRSCRFVRSLVLLQIRKMLLKSYEEDTKQISSGSANNKNLVLVIFAGMALKLEKVEPLFSRVNPWLSLPSVEKGDRKHVGNTWI